MILGGVIFYFLLVLGYLIVFSLHLMLSFFFVLFFVRSLSLVLMHMQGIFKRIYTYSCTLLSIHRL
jgi:hypothetical protein